MILISPSLNRGLEVTLSSAEPTTADSAMNTAPTTASAMRDTVRPARLVPEIMASALEAHCAERATRIAAMLSRNCRSCACLADRAPHSFGRGRHVEIRHVQRRQRVQDGVDDGARRANGAALAGAFDAERVGGAR